MAGLGQVGYTQRYENVNPNSKLRKEKSCRGRMERKARASQEGNGWWCTSREKDLVGGVPVVDNEDGGRELKPVIGVEVIEGVGRDGATCGGHRGHCQSGRRCCQGTETWDGSQRQH